MMTIISPELHWLSRLVKSFFSSLSICYSYFCSKDSTCCGISFACDNTETAACSRIFCCVYSVISDAISVSISPEYAVVISSCVSARLELAYSRRFVYAPIPERTALNFAIAASIVLMALSAPPLTATFTVSRYRLSEENFWNMYIHILILVRTDLNCHCTDIRHVKYKRRSCCLYIITQQKIHGKSTLIRDFHTIFPRHL